ncbi:EmrB/QacA subfamily drug resistance transporter [Tardiphaga robiniae]|uniref:DHA2 family efflux MFS transporter permease subunit n=1 Tax=Tardiphaga robiniae TaxID=943830 RepID=UPI00286308D4|nr:DHA2 family efflux MFS transporter permease subunit [Tardiphaga robiniae]MDR6660841.1 EmrB/QacA subfamily drug resistance transporter [Tardiphaga robiniae]
MVTSAVHLAGEVASAKSTKLSAPANRPYLVLSTCVLASSMALIDGSVVNVGLPTIGRSLSADPGVLPWVITAYLIPLTSLLLLGGAAGDRFGRRRLLIVGVVLFAIASTLCASAPNLTMLLAGRFVQGASAALLMPNSLAVLGQTFQGEAKGRAIGIWASAGAVAGAIGPVTGGSLIDLVSWRCVFVINVPLAAASVWLVWRHVPKDIAGSGSRLDLLGGSLATLGLGGLAWALTEGSASGGWTVKTAAVAVLASFLLAAFLMVEMRRRDEAMLPLRLLASRMFAGLTMLTLLLYGALAAVLVLLPYTLMRIGGFTSAAAGAAMLPLPVTLSLVSPFIGSIAARTRPGIVLGVGALVVASGFLLALRIGPETTYLGEVLPAIFVLALGLSCAAAPLTTAVLSSVDMKHAGSASGFNSAVARTGGLIATSLLAAVMTSEGDAYMRSFDVALVAAAVACLAASLIAFTMLEPKPV